MTATSKKCGYRQWFRMQKRYKSLSIFFFTQMKYGDVPDCISEWKNIGLNYKKGIYNIKLNCRQICWVTIITDKVAKKIDNLQLKMIKAVSTKKVTNSLIKTVWKRQLCLIMRGCFWNVYLLATDILEWVRLGAALLLCWIKSKGILSIIIVKIVREIISFNCKQTRLVSSDN